MPKASNSSTPLCALQHAVLEADKSAAVMGRDLVEKRPAPHLCQAGRLQHAQSGGIHVEQIAIRRNDRHAFRHRRDNRAQSPFAFLQRGFAALEFGDIDKGDHDLPVRGTALTDQVITAVRPATLDHAAVGITVPRHPLDDKRIDVIDFAHGLEHAAAVHGQ